MKTTLLLAMLANVAGASVLCEDSESWFKAGEPEKNCDWVAELSSSVRCNRRDAQGIYGFDACIKTCSERMGKIPGLERRRKLQDTIGCTVGTKESSASGDLEPKLPGYLGGKAKPKVALAADINYPPYALMNDETLELSGFGVEFAQHLETVCDLEVVAVQTQWGKCWDSDEIGIGLLDGYYSGCMTYTNAKGVRGRYLEFSDAILNENKPAGIIARLDDQGVPSVSPQSNLDGVTVIDVVGWAPTSDSLALVTNPCTSEPYVGYNIVQPSVSTSSNANDNALRALLQGEGDAIWIYSDQAASYACADGATSSEWDCDLWNLLGTNFTYVASGVTGYANNGTTLSIAKLGAGLADILDPCIAKFIQTEDYYDLCREYGLVESCFTNPFFPAGENTIDDFYNDPTPQQPGPCASGYCTCDGL